ncbi:Beta-galactosidase [Novipirellula aureliae]|uniref:Beta-galactosidase n=1 Tax=Novipirellula aureliae TaxID=2527966 RepID=A0A5C6E7R6_9BACT|nr:glycoside hydrolase family 2 TIM barrel-domain containing protein [Novipirellula aureliae]TWU44848.1 Beta-galactosidase [Novipirellula aureliae]
MKSSILLSFLLGLMMTSQAQSVSTDFDADWKFHLGDAPGAEQPTLNDQSWRSLRLPHDWAFESDYSRDAAQTDKGGYKPGGIGWYRKAFDFSDEWENQKVFIAFDGVFMNSKVWLNGHLLGERPYGYIRFEYDLTPYLQPKNNVLAVRVDCSREPAARWYHGCGIYGHVKLEAHAAVHVVTDGVCITTPEVSDRMAEVNVQTEIANTLDRSERITLETLLLDPDGKEIARESEGHSIGGNGIQVFDKKFQVSSPRRWDTKTPSLYTVVSRIKLNGKWLGETRSRFGIRTIRWDTATGFWLNEKNVKLQGVCDHLEAGPVGAASPDELIAWKIRLLKEMGCNAIRTAHNPQVPKFYELCDEMGMLVMDEIFDGWKKKAAQDYGKQAFDQWWERDLRAWLRRDRNHPSVVVWSLGNETGGNIAKELVRVCHEVDPTRSVTSGHSGSEFMDVEGVNGASERPMFFDHTPDKPFVATEAPHTWQVRGYYRTKTWFRDGYPANNAKRAFACPDLTEQEIFHYDWAPPGGNRNRKQIFNSSYDNAMVRITARKNWELMRDLPWYSGHFRWTGFDYLGEAGYVHGGWPFRAFMGGALDLAGFKKDLYYFYQSQWTEEPMVHILPHWTHPVMESGTEIPVWVYSNCDEVELFLNGKSLGKDRPGTKWDEMQCEWLVPWTSGTVEAVGYRNGREVARRSQTTSGAPAALKVTVEGDACPIITVSEVDENGVLNPYAENRIHYFISGPASILSLESGNPVNTENNFGTTSRTAFFGLGRAFLRLSGVEVSENENKVSAVVGAICGEPQLLTSNKIHIDAQSCSIRGEVMPRDLKIFYSTDGSDPRTPYIGGFEVQPGTTVKAAVYDGDLFLFDMEEQFAEGLGLYWGDAGSDEASQAAIGDQAEDAKLSSAVVKRNGKGFHGKGYVDFGNNQGSVEWYQENDGSPETVALHFRYSGNAKGRSGRPMKLIVNGVESELFFKNTANWGSDWKTVTVEARLNSGANHIVLSTIGRGGMYIDELIVE